MRGSTDVREALLRFFDRISESDVEVFDDVVSADPATFVVGTAPGELVRERERLRFGFEAEGLRLDPGEQPVAYEEGPLGWAYDEPTMTYPDGTEVHTRLTAIFQRDGDTWKLLHAHYSVGVPDDEVGELQQRWGT